MAFLQLPEYIYSGFDSLGGIFDAESKKFILVIADSKTAFTADFTQTMLTKADKHGVKIEFIVEDNPEITAEMIQQKLETETPALIVGAGDGKIIDCACAVSSMTGIPYCAAPCCAPTAIWESDTFEAIITRRMPSVCILDPELIISIDSAKIAYEAMGMLAICAESYHTARNRYVKTMAKIAFGQIFQNVLPSYRGEISARESLLEGMYWSYVSYVNSYSFSWESACYRLCDFFRGFSSDSLSLLAVSGVQIIKNVYADDDDSLCSLADGLEITKQKELSGVFLVEKIRQLRAQLGIPSCIRNLGGDETRFMQLSRDICDEDRLLFESCFYAGFHEEKKNALC